MPSRWPCFQVNDPVVRFSNVESPFTWPSLVPFYLAVHREVLSRDFEPGSLLYLSMFRVLSQGFGFRTYRAHSEDLSLSFRH